MTRSPHRRSTRPALLLLSAVLVGSSGAAHATLRPAQVVPSVATAAAAATGLGCSLVGDLRLCSHGDDALLRPGGAHVRGEAGPQASTASKRVGCYGNGRSGARIVPIYLRASGSADRFGQFVDRFRGWAGAIEKSIDDTAHKTGGARHVRFVTTAGTSCSLVIERLTVPAEALASFPGTVQALKQRGLDKPGSKYLLWTESSVYCGIASTYDDSSPGADNLNNGRLPTYARVDRSCWGHAEAHEVMHMLGGVSPRAPHGTGGFHCNDGVEQMCYDDGTRGSRQRAVCPKEHARLFDCRNDDYFSTKPVAGSWLATHWNVASSSFLSPAWSAAEPAPAPAPPPAEAEPSEQDQEPSGLLPPLPPIRP